MGLGFIWKDYWGGKEDCVGEGLQNELSLGVAAGLECVVEDGVVEDSIRVVDAFCYFY